MKANMVESQFNTLERPDDEDRVAVIDIDTNIDQVVERALQALMQLNTRNETKVSA
ncbi:Gluconokinase (fragment) [Vibrio aestuarianus]